MLALAQTSANTGLADACGETNRRFVCERVYDWTGNDGLATAADWLLDRPIRIALILVLAWFVTRVVKRSIVRFTKRIAATPSSSRLQKLRERGPVRALADEVERSRAESRAETLGSVLRSVAVGPHLDVRGADHPGRDRCEPRSADRRRAGIGGIALGFGSQAIVKDFLSGLFMLIEDHYGVGDVVDLGDAVGTVEEVSAAVDHHPGCEGHGVARPQRADRPGGQLLPAVVEGADRRPRWPTTPTCAWPWGVIQRVANEFWEDPEWGGDELAECPDVWGVQYLGASGIALRVAVKTEPSMQWSVERELRLRLKEAFDEAGIEIPFPQQTVWFRDSGRRVRPEAVGGRRGHRPSPLRREARPESRRRRLVPGSEVGRGVQVAGP